MFTGLIEASGRVIEVTPGPTATRLVVRPIPGFEALVHGESIAVDGACLTVVERSEELFHADVIPETLARTTLGALRPDDRVNLERALRIGERLGGHLVQGHVDATAPLLGTVAQGGERRLRVGLTEETRPYVAFKGSVALQGVSLTVAGIDPVGFEVALIPETLARTNLGDFRVGDRLNVEVDLVARYLERLVATGRGPR